MYIPPSTRKWAKISDVPRERVCGGESEKTPKQYNNYLPRWWRFRCRIRNLRKYWVRWTRDAVGPSFPAWSSCFGCSCIELYGYYVVVDAFALRELVYNRKLAVFSRVRLNSGFFDLRTIKLYYFSFTSVVGAGGSGTDVRILYHKHNLTRRTKRLGRRLI